MIYLTNIVPVPSDQEETLKYEVTLDVAGTITTCMVQSVPAGLPGVDMRIYQPADTKLKTSTTGLHSHSHVIHATSKWVAGQIDLPYLIEGYHDPILMHRLSGLSESLYHYKGCHLSIELQGPHFTWGTLNWSNGLSQCEIEFAGLESAINLLRQYIPSNYWPPEEQLL